MFGILDQIFELITNAIYIFIFIFAMTGFVLFSRARYKQIGFWWLSLMGNILLFSYFSNDYGLSDLIYYAQIFTIIAWPILNIAWLISVVSNEKKKAKNNQISDESRKNLKRIILTLAGILLVVTVTIYLIVSNFAHQFISGT